MPIWIGTQQHTDQDISILVVSLIRIVVFVLIDVEIGNNIKNGNTYN